MNSATSIQDLIQRMKNLLNDNAFRKLDCFIGFDGFTDDIISVVDKRDSLDSFKRMELIEQLGKRIVAAAGKSTNIELVVTRRKLGGNAPILANALIQWQHAITFAGAIGAEGKIEPLFEEMAKLCTKVFPLCASGHSDALEFNDGKIILGKHASLVEVNATNLLKAVPEQQLIQILNQSKLFASVNWTMLLSMNHLWETLLQDILPKSSVNPKKQSLFVDLADPAKRSDEDLIKALELLQSFKKYYCIVLGLNEAEALRIAKVCGKDFSQEKERNIINIAQYIQEQTQLNQIVLHSAKLAVVATNELLEEVEVPYCLKPRLKTGCGDNFNAGYCNGLLYELSPKESLILGVATAGYYVRQMHSPNPEQLLNFLEQWDKQQLDS